MGADDHVSLADPFHVLEHLLPLSANNPAYPSSLTNLLTENVYHSRTTIVLSYLHREIHQPAINLDLLFIYRTAERRTLLHEIQMKAGHAWHRKKLASNTWQEATCYCSCSLENPFKVIQVLQSCGLKFTRARSDLADTSYSGVTLLTPTGLLRFKPEARSRLCYFFEMVHS